MLQSAACSVPATNGCFPPYINKRGDTMSHTMSHCLLHVRLKTLTLIASLITSCLSCPKSTTLTPKSYKGLIRPSRSVTEDGLRHFLNDASHGHSNMHCRPQRHPERLRCFAHCKRADALNEAEQGPRLVRLAAVCGGLNDFAAAAAAVGGNGIFSGHPVAAGQGIICGRPRQVLVSLQGTRPSGS